MTNAMIILLESVKLMEQGILKPTGEKIVVQDSEGNKKELDVPEPIHTYQSWKSVGYQVKKGSKAVAQFAVWKYITGKMKEAEVNDEVDVEQNENKGYCRMKVASFFTQEQVEKIQEVAK